MLNLKRLELQMKTTYPVRKSGKPMFSVTASGTACFNVKFKEEFFPKSKKLFIQLTLWKGNYYFLISKVKRDNFFKLTETSKTLSTAQKSVVSILGKKGTVVRYSITPELTNDESIYGFKLTAVSEDFFISKDINKRGS